MPICDLRGCAWLSTTFKTVLGLALSFTSVQIAACSATDPGTNHGLAAGSTNVAGSAGAFVADGETIGKGGSTSGAAAFGNVAGADLGSSAGSGGSGAGSAGSGAGTGSVAGSAGSAANGTGAPDVTATGYGQGTTGGGKSKAVVVATFAALQAAIDGYSGTGGLVLEYTGKFDFTSIKDPCVQHTLPAQTIEIKNKSEISVLGATGSSANFGFHIAAGASNVIIRNMTIGLLPGGSDSDIISIEGMSGGVPKNIWIDHNELFSSLAVCAGAGDTAFDGMLDIKKGADLITVSYNYLHDHHKVSLNGYTDSDDVVRHITFHHNWFENIGSRVPLQRHGYAHVVNNLFSKVQASGINVRMGGYALIEANYFEDVKNPVTSRDSSAVGFWDLRNNNLASAADVAPGNRFGITWDDGNSGTVNATAWTTTAAFPIALGYSLTAQPAQCVHDGLRAAAGANKELVTLECK